MKKILAIILASLMLLTLVACGNGNNEETTTDAPANNEETTLGGNEETTEGGNDEETTVGGNVDVNANVVVPNVDANTWGYAFWNVFSESVRNNPEITTGEIVANILASEAGQALGFCENMDMVEGFLPGFSADITGFKSATVFTPSAAGFAFMGYAFELEDVASVNTFMQTLDTNKDMRFMVCMTAEMATIGAYENYVLFVMSPTNMPSAGGASDATIVYPENAEDGTYASEIFFFFEQAMNENPSAGAEEMAYAVAYSPVVPYNMADVNTVDTTVANEHFANGFDGIESIFSVSEEGSDLVVYLFTIELGLDVTNWSSWYVTGEDAVCGAYNNVVIVIHNGNDYIQ